ncbi:MAG TPA: hypothetical protein VGJ05_18235 [Fimbriiglobus sp.]|jgi:hypothetical protein
MKRWSSARQTNNPNEWSSEQWAPNVRDEANYFAYQLRSHAFASPVLFFAEWIDKWSMGDDFSRWLTPPGGQKALQVMTDEYQINSYALPDEGRLIQHLAAAAPQQHQEADWFIVRLREAIGAWENLADRATLIVLRHVHESSAIDQELAASLKELPDWLA